MKKTGVSIYLVEQGFRSEEQFSEHAGDEQLFRFLTPHSHSVAVLEGVLSNSIKNAVIVVCTGRVASSKTAAIQGVTINRRKGT